MIDSLTHHAYGIAGKAEELIPKLIFELERSIGFSARGNPDFHIESYDVMGIDESRALKESAGRKAISGGKKIFIISARGITKEAQNALLKVFEEPPEDTHFFLIVSSLEILLSTLRSRLFVVRTDGANEKKPSFLAGDFLRAAIPARLKTIQVLLKNAEEETGKKELIAFIDEIEQTAADTRRLKTQMYADEERVKALFEILKVKKYCRDRAPSFKLLLEHVALVLPRIM